MLQFFQLFPLFMLVVVFVLGAVVGSFLNVCIYRLPLEKSLIWPGSRCGHCLQRIRGYDNIPLLSYWLLRGRCRMCGAHFSIRYFLIELLTALSLVGLYYLEVVENILRIDPNPGLPGAWPPLAGRMVVFLYHAILVCFLIVATFCDLDRQVIPLPLTITGTIIGLAGGLLLPWPWPYLPAEAVPGPPLGLRGWLGPAQQGLKPDPLYGLQLWPVWHPQPSWLRPGTWQIGLATSVAGLVVGTLLLRGIRFLFGIGGGAKYMEEIAEPGLQQQPSWFFGRWLAWVQRVGGKALGLGDADLMMMAGSFLGWQAVLVGFLISPFPGLLIAFFLLLAGTLRQRTPPILEPAFSPRATPLTPAIAKPLEVPAFPVKDFDQSAESGASPPFPPVAEMTPSLPPPAESTPALAPEAPVSPALPSSFSPEAAPSITIPFGPGLAVGVLLALLNWDWIGTRWKPLFFDLIIIGILVGSACVFMMMAGFVIRMMKGRRS